MVQYLSHMDNCKQKKVEKICALPCKLSLLTTILICFIPYCSAATGSHDPNSIIKISKDQTESDSIDRSIPYLNSNTSSSDLLSTEKKSENLFIEEFEKYVYNNSALTGISEEKKRYLCDKTISDLFYKISNINTRLQRSDPSYIKEALKAGNSSQTNDILFYIRHLFYGLDNERSAYLLNNKDIKMYVLKDKSLEDILMTISLHGYIAVPEDVKDLVEPLLNLINRNTPCSLNERETMALRKIIMIYPSYEIKGSRVLKNREMAFNIWQTVKNYTKLKHQFLQLKSKVEILNTLKGPFHQDIISRNKEENILCNIDFTYLGGYQELFLGKLKIDNHSFLDDYELLFKHIKVLYTFFNINSVKFLEIKNFNVDVRKNDKLVFRYEKILHNFLKKLKNLEILSLMNLDPRIFFHHTEQLDFMFQENTKLHSLYLTDLICDFESNWTQLFVLSMSNQKRFNHIKISYPRFEIDRLFTDINSSLHLAFMGPKGQPEELTISCRRDQTFSIKYLVDCLNGIFSLKNMFNENNSAALGSKKQSTQTNPQSGLKKLHLNCKFRNTEEILYLLRNIRTLELLEFDSSCLFTTQDEMKVLIEEIKAYPQDLQIKTNGFELIGSNALSLCLKSRYEKCILDLTNINLDVDLDEVISILESDNASYRGIKTVSFADAMLKLHRFTKFLVQLKNTEIEHIDLSNNFRLLVNNNPSEIEAFCSALKNLNSLKSLKFTNTINSLHVFYLENLFCLENIAKSVSQIKYFDTLDFRGFWLLISDKNTAQYYLNLFNDLKRVKNVYFDLLATNLSLKEVDELILKVVMNPDFENLHLRIYRCIKRGNEYLKHLQWEFN